jgi:hypothetical protein
LAETSKLALAITLFTITFTACGPRRVALPSGPGTPAPGYAQALAGARASCENVRTLQGELALSGRAVGQRLRGRIHAGFAQGALRLEGVAPFGSPVFILVASGAKGTLLLLRDRRVLQDAPPEEILNALVGISLGPDDLRALLAGCVKAQADPAAGQAYGADWMSVELVSGGTIYLHRDGGAWRILAGRYGELEIDYTAFQGERPSEIALRGKDLELMLALNQVEINGDLPSGPLVAVTIPPGVSPMTLEELRRAGPLGR